MSKSSRKTTDFEGMKYSPELIRRLSDPEYAKKAEAYERMARAGKTRSIKEEPAVDIDDYLAGYIEPSKGGRRSKKKGSGDDGNYGQGDGTKRGKSRKNKTGKKYKLNKKKLIRNILLVLVLLIAVVLGVFYHLTRTFDKVDTSNADFAIDPQVADELSDYRNIAILGVDARADEGYDGSRTDAIIVMSINKKSGDVHLISVMRDSYLKMEYLDGSMILDKITHAHHYAGGVNTCAALNRSLDLNIDEFIIFNWKAVADMVDGLGGIEVDVQENEIADMNHWGYETADNVGGTFTEITATGPQTFDGVQAVTYCRIRKTSGGDNGRASRYKTVVTAVMKKAISHPLRAAELSDTVFPNIRTNMSRTQMLTLGAGFIRYDIGDSIGFPEEYYAGLLSDGISYVVPTTLETNVQTLHEKAFEQINYQLSDTALDINDDIINDTGIQ